MNHESAFIIYADLHFLIEKINWCKNNTENSSTTKEGEHIPSSFSMSTTSSFKSIETKLDKYKSKDCIKTFSKSLRKHALEVISLKPKKIKQLTNYQQRWY